jgi:hypothetical protein
MVIVEVIFLSVTGAAIVVALLGSFFYLTTLGTIRRKDNS